MQNMPSGSISEEKFSALKIKLGYGFASSQQAIDLVEKLQSAASRTIFLELALDNFYRRDEHFLDDISRLLHLIHLIPDDETRLSIGKRLANDEGQDLIVSYAGILSLTNENDQKEALIKKLVSDFYSVNTLDVLTLFHSDMAKEIIIAVLDDYDSQPGRSQESSATRLRNWSVNS